MAGHITPDQDGEILRPSFPDIHETERPYTKVSHGIPFDVACKKHIDGFINAQRVYIIASKGLVAASDALTRLQTALGDKHVGTWKGIPVHSPWDALIPIMDDIRTKEVDCIITLGGGSLADGAKLIVFALANDCRTVEDIRTLSKAFVGKGAADLKNEVTARGHAPTIALVFLPTTLSGAEYSRYGGCTDPVTRMKVQFTHPDMFARLLVLDPALCRTTPDWVWRSTGVRAIDHCVENICSTNAHPDSDTACARGLPRLVRSLLTYVRHHDDPARDQHHDGELDAARLESQLGCNNAMTGLTLRVMCGASHGIGHNLGPLGVGHGQTSCILLPAVMKFNAGANGAQQEVVKGILWDDECIADVLVRRGLSRESSDAGDALRAIFDELGMPRTLTDVGVTRDQWDQLAVNSLEDYFCIVNPIPLTRPEQVKEILEAVAGDGQ